MKLSAFDTRLWWILAGLGILFALIVLVGNFIGLKPPELIPENGLIGSPGPVKLVFSQSMEPDSVETRMTFDPPMEGKFLWRGVEGTPNRMVSFWPDVPIYPSQKILVRLAPGARSQTGLILRHAQVWQVEVRPAEVLYLSPVEKPDLWRATPDGASRFRITNTGGTVYDYALSPDGNRIVFSARNDLAGVDLWEVSRDGGEPELLLPCQSDWCVNPAYAPDGLTIVYSRRRTGAVIGQGPDAPRIWVFDLSSRTTDLLYVDPNIGGMEPAWSPDGRFLAFYDSLSGGIRVRNVTQKTDFLAPSQAGQNGNWSPDSQSLIFTDSILGEEGPYVVAYVVDVQTQQIRQVLKKDLALVDYSNPAWIRDGTALVTALRLVNGSPAKQLWLIPIDSESLLESGVRQEITNNQLYTHAGYHWDPMGENLVFQRLELGSSDAKPEVAVWNRINQSSNLVAENAFQPRWLP